MTDEPMHKLSVAVCGDTLLIAHPVANPLMVTHENGQFQITELTRKQFTDIQRAGGLPKPPQGERT